jgi:hypothetical protein
MYALEHSCKNGENGYPILCLPGERNRLPFCAFSQFYFRVTVGGSISALMAHVKSGSGRLAGWLHQNQEEVMRPGILHALRVSASGSLISVASHSRKEIVVCPGDLNGLLRAQLSFGRSLKRVVTLIRKRFWSLSL